MLSGRIIVALLGAFAIGSWAAGPELTSAENGSFSWAGSNLYFLHGLDADTQSLYIETLAAWGVKVLRLWGELFIPTSPCVPSEVVFPHS